MMGWFTNLLGITKKVEETATEVNQELQAAEDLKASIRSLKGKQLTPAVIADLCRQVDGLVAGAKAIVK